VKNELAILNKKGGKEAVQAVVDKLEQDALYNRLVSLIEQFFATKP
jgi:hypothetical protein